MLIGKHAVVIGSGIGGISVAGALSPFFEQVTVVDRDQMPSTPDHRRGTPQGLHGHALLAGGQRALSNIFPGLEQALEERGAIKVTQSKDMLMILPFSTRVPQIDLGFHSYAMSRPLLEFTLRDQLKKIPNVNIRTGFEVKTLLYNPQKNTVTGVKGNVAGHEETLTANIVIDASNGGRPTQSIVKALGLYTKPDTVIGIDIGYSTAIFEIPESAPMDWKSLLLFPSPDEDHSAALVLPIEGNRWQISISGRLVGYPPADEDGLREYVRQFRTSDVHDVISGAKMVSDISRFRLKESRIRHFGLPQKFPRGVLPLGDAVCKFNPIYGQGMTSAAIQSNILRSLLQTYCNEPDPMDAIVSPYFQQVNDLIDTPWMMSAIPDLSYPNAIGERPKGFDTSQKSNDIILNIANKDTNVLKLLLEVMHLLKPRSAFADTDLLEKLRLAY